MPFNVKYDDITTYNVEVVVNSLGVKGKIYGKLCRNIIKNANDPKLKTFIDSQVNPVGTILVTDAGKLKAKKIIHVVTPFKKDDNKENALLVKAYKDCINKAIELGVKSIALPFIGTGANGYSEADAFDAIGDACVDILMEEERLDKDILDITVVGYLKPYNELNCINESHYSLRGRELSLEERYEKSIKFGRCRIEYEHKLIEEFYNFSNMMSKIDPSDLLVPSRPYYYPFDFYDDYVYQNNIHEPSITKKGFTRQHKYRMRNSDTLKKEDIYRLAFLVGMNKAQIFQWMHIAGLCFSPISELDKLYLGYINGKYKKYENFFEFSRFVYSKTGINLTF